MIISLVTFKLLCDYVGNYNISLEEGGRSYKEQVLCLCHAHMNIQKKVMIPIKYFGDCKTVYGK